MNLVYNIKDKPKFGQVLLFALQQLLAIMATTIAVSGLKMIQKVDLNNNRNLFVVSMILVAGVGGLTVSFGKITLTTVACALILGIVANLVLGGMSKKNAEPVEEETPEEEK